MTRTSWILAAALVGAVALSPVTAEAGRLITGKDIKDGTVTTADVKNDTVKVADLAFDLAPVGTVYEWTVTGPEGVQPGQSQMMIPSHSLVTGLDMDLNDTSFAGCQYPGVSAMVVGASTIVSGDPEADVWRPTVSEVVTGGEPKPLLLQIGCQTNFRPAHNITVRFVVHPLSVGNAAKDFS